MCQEHDVNCCVVGVPKSIDNDILLIDKCFGFDTAVEEAQRALLAAKVGAAPGRVWQAAGAGRVGLAWGSVQAVALEHSSWTRAMEGSMGGGSPPPAHCAS